jgi:hypothetical protein
MAFIDTGNDIVDPDRNEKRTAMKALTYTILCSAIVMMPEAMSTASAQDNHDKKAIQQDASVIRQDQLKADLTTPADKRDTDVYTRTVSIGENGFYDVVITDMEGDLRMTGRYLDAELKTADGFFTYYHPNGNVESRGLYANGLKTGTWERFAADGTPKAERVYTGMTWEDMAVMLGVPE